MKQWLNTNKWWLIIIGALIIGMIIEASIATSYHNKYNAEIQTNTDLNAKINVSNADKLKLLDATSQLKDQIQALITKDNTVINHTQNNINHATTIHNPAVISNDSIDRIISGIIHNR